MDEWVRGALPDPSLMVALCRLILTRATNHTARPKPFLSLPLLDAVPIGTE